MQDHEDVHKVNWCLECFSSYDRGSGSCPKCGRRNRRSYLKSGEKENKN